jgi:RNA polymerase sigma-70 factor (ECF subfamily)
MGVPVQIQVRDVGESAAEADASPKGRIELDDTQGDLPRDVAERNRRFADLAERHARLMFRVAHGLLRSVQDAEDAVQEALLKLYRTGGWQHMENEKAFLARTVWRSGLDIVARRQSAGEPLEGEHGREFAADDASAEERLVGHGERELLRELIEGLPEELRQPLVLCAIEEMTSREIAIAMGIPEGTVRTRMMRARAELKRRFAAIEMRRRRAAESLQR